MQVRVIFLCVATHTSGFGAKMYAQAVAAMANFSQFEACKSDHFLTGFCQN